MHKTFYSFLLCFIVFLSLNYADAADREQYQAIYLGRFPNYVTWSSELGDSFNLCILGQDTFKTFLQSRYYEKLIKSKPVKLYFLNNVKDASACHLLYISVSERRKVSEILRFVQNKPILTVSEIRGFAEKKGIIQFYMQGQNLRFKINNQAALNHGLKISAKLLAIAKVVDR